MKSTALRSASAITAVIALAVAGVDGLGNTAINNNFSSTDHSQSSSVLDLSYGLVPNVSVTAHNTTTPNANTVLQTVSVCASSSNQAGNSGSTFSSRPLIGTSYEDSLSQTNTSRASTASASSSRIPTSSSSTPKTSLIARANEPAVPDDRDVPVGYTIIYSGNSTSTIINVGTGSSSPLIKMPTHTAPGSSSLIAASIGNSPSSPATRSTTTHTSTRSPSTETSTGSPSSTKSANGSTSTRSSSTKESPGSSTAGHSTSPGQSPSPVTTKQSINHGQESDGGSAHSGTPSPPIKGPGTWYPEITGLPHVPTITPGPISTSFSGPVTANHTMLNATTTTTAHNVTAPVWIGSIRKHEAESEVSSVSTYFLNILPTISDWELKPDPPLETDIIKKIKGFEDHIKDLGIKIDPKWKPECPSVVKRGLVDGLIDSVTNVVKTGVGATTSVLSALGCIDDNTKRLIKSIENRNTETVKGIVDTLTKSNPPKDDKPKDDDPEDDEDPSSSTTKTSTTTTKTSTKSKDEDDHSTMTTKTKDDDDHSTTTSKSTKTKDDDDHSTTTTKSQDNGPPITETTTTCTKHTAHHVTVLCSPTFSTVGTVTKTSTTCSPTTTLTTTGCSASETTTTVTAAPTETGQWCSKGSCGTSCQGGSGGWLDLGEIDCAKIPISTVTSLPNPTQGIKVRGYQLEIRADNNPPAHLDPLPPLPPPPDNLNPAGGEDNYIHQVGVWFDQQNLWLNLYGPTETTFEWVPFQSRKSAIGMKGLTGCVGLFIVSARGMFMAHFWEHPTIVMGIRNDKPVYSLPGDINRDITNVLRPEITRLVESGDLHPDHHPKIFLISPFRGYETDGPLLHMRILEQIGPQIDRMIYPEGMAHETIKLFGYRRTTKEHSNDPTTPWGKLIMEGTPLMRWYEGPRGYIPVGHVRFWVGGKLMIDQDFWSPKDSSDAGFGQTEASTNQADDDDDSDSDDSLMVDMDDWNENGGAKRAIKRRAGVCPMPTKTKTSTKSTSESTSKTITTSTKSTIKLPVATSTKSSTTKSSTTTSSTTKSSPKPTSTETSTTKSITKSTTKTSTTNSTTKSTTKTSSTKSTTKKPSTFATSTKSKPETNTERPGGQPPGFTLPTYQLPKTTKTKQETNTKNPGGQPPGFNLPTYDPPKTTKTTSSNNPGPTYPLGEPPDDSDFETACEIRRYGNGHMPAYNRELYEKITNMCTDKISDKQKNFDKDSKAISWTANTDDKKTYYYAEVGWSRGCEGEKKTVNVLKPKEGLDCKTLLRANFQGCRTPSFGGGTTTIHCISYQLRQGKDGN
ncbi:uncharacterized protein BDV14DRAFT_196984 [Aspergillus stella-maris]|uniref:uncharacterized protein n=1 Tax=Aspergillus stella-maris TaxID=1810926 RepID=UPI003CCD562E